MYIPDFNYHKPSTTLEACEILNKSKNAAPLAGGTDMLVEIRKGGRHHDDIVSLQAISELREIKEKDSNIYIGACVTHNQLMTSPIIKQHARGLSYAAARIGSEQIRNTATIGGNLCTGASCADIAPALLAMNATLEIKGIKEVKQIAISDFFQHHRVTQIGKGEILTHIIVPKLSKNTGVCFEKFGLRDAASISVASAFAKLTIEKDTITDACIVIGAVAPTPRISENATKYIKGVKISELKENKNILVEAGEAASKDSIPIDDIRGSADYRRQIIKVLTQRAIMKAVESMEK